MSDGKFFEKRAKAANGRFFRDLPGREDGKFHKGAQSSYGPGIGAAMSGTMGGAFNVGGINPGGNSVFGTGKGCASKKKPVPPMKKKAEDPTENRPTGEHRATNEQPRDLNPGGARFLQEGTDTLPAGIPASNLQQAKMKKRAADLRFMGTSFEKRGGRDDLKSKVTSDVRRAPGGAAEAGERMLSSAYRGGGRAYGAVSGGVKKLVDKVTSSDALSLLALGLGGYGAAKLVGRGAKGIARLGRKPKPKPSMASSLLAKIKGR